MTNVIDPQPAPIPQPDREASFDQVITDLLALCRDRRESLDAVVEDLRARDKFGVAKYGVRHTANNGRDHLVDAYQEALDQVAYLRAEMERHSVTLVSWDSPWSYTLWETYINALHQLVRLRGLIDSRPEVP